MPDRLVGLDFAQHNAEVKALWDAFPAGKAPRVPIVFGTNARYFMVNADANPTGVEFQRYTEDRDLMFDTLLRFQRWSRFNLLQDTELGLPDRWSIAPDFQNYYEAAAFGCKVEYLPDQVPDTQPEFADAPERVMEHGVPDPFAGFSAKALAYFEHFQSRARRETYLDRPINVTAPMCGTDGVMTVACNLFGGSFVCEAMAGEPERLHKLFDFITEATIRRMTAWRKLAGIPVPTNDGFGFADDSVAMISTGMYREHVLPYHRRMCDAFSSPTQLRGIHLCGDSTRHFHTIRDELNVQVFDTGFPVDFGGLRRDLGPLVRLQGGPHVELLHSGTPAAIRADVQRVLQTGVTDGRRFVLREGNNLAPATPLANTEALYKAGREFGKFS